MLRLQTLLIYFRNVYAFGGRPFESSRLVDVNKNNVVSRQLEIKSVLPRNPRGIGAGAINREAKNPEFSDVQILTLRNLQGVVEQIFILISFFFNKSKRCYLH